jgi:hypothetical protein
MREMPPVLPPNVHSVTEKFLENGEKYSEKRHPVPSCKLLEPKQARGQIEDTDDWPEKVALADSMITKLMGLGVMKQAMRRMKASVERMNAIA